MRDIFIIVIIILIICCTGMVVFKINTTKKKRKSVIVPEKNMNNDLPSRENMMEIMTLFECLDEIYKSK